jgi:capsular exopolysaccharide synthesis family protein
MQRWVTVAVIAVLGGVGAFVVFRTLPVIYQGSSTFEMSVRPKKVLRGDTVFTEENIGQVDEILNTRLASLRSRNILMAIVQRYHNENPSSVVPDNEIVQTLTGDTGVSLLRRTRLVQVTVRSRNQELAVALANAYVMAVDTYTQEENRQQAEKAVDWLKSIVESQKRELLRKDQEILDIRAANQIDALESERKKSEAAQLTLNADAVSLETQINREGELLKALDRVLADPFKFGSIPNDTPRAEGLLATHQRMQTSQTELNVLLTRLTANHPDVTAKQKEVEQLRQQFLDDVARVHATSKATLEHRLAQQRDTLRRCSETDKRVSELDSKIITARMRLETMLRERDVSEQNFRAILNREREAALSVDDNAATIKVIEKAQIETDSRGRPVAVSPNPYIIFPAGPILGIFFGVIFVLLLDRMEDQITGITDIEDRLRLKVLTVLPHIDRAKREEVALMSAHDRFSHFAEAFAGLRSMLASHRYVSFSKVLLFFSTQPGEGKTCSATNFALTCALSGQRTLLVDFDMRRPRLARIFGKERRDYQSLVHTLARNDPSLFGSLPVPSRYPNLDLVCSAASSELSPSMVLGSGVAAQFIGWARANYERIIIDSAPFGLVSDAVVLSALADGIVVLCCPERTRFRALVHAVRQLMEVGGHIVGVIANDVNFARTGMLDHYGNSGYPYQTADHERYREEEGADEAASASAAADTRPDVATPQTARPGAAVQPVSMWEDDE